MSDIASKDAPEIMSFFNYSHLPHNLASISKPFCELAWTLNDELSEGRQKEMALEFLLLAKDAAVRTAVKTLVDPQIV